VARFSDSEYGKMIRNQFKDIRGGSELAMLAAPSSEELEQLKRAVAIMTPSEKEKADSLNDEQIQRIAADAGIDPANLAIFINGFALHCKRVS
jgi:signal recognition particle GTPase